MNKDIVNIDIKNNSFFWHTIKPASEEAGFFESIIIK